MILIEMMLEVVIGVVHSDSEKGRMSTISFLTIFSIEKCSVRLG